MSLHSPMGFSSLRLAPCTLRCTVGEVLISSIHLVHDDNKDKEFELEMTWVCTETGNKHKAVPEDLLKEAEEKARAALEEGMEED